MEFKPKDSLEDFLVDDAEYFAINNCLHQYLMRNLNANKLTFSFPIDFNYNTYYKCLFNSAYILFERINTDSCPQAKLQQYITETRVFIKNALKYDGIEINEDDFLTFSAYHSLCLCYSLLNIPFPQWENKGIPPVIGAILSLDINIGDPYHFSFSKILEGYISLINCSRDWRDAKEECMQNEENDNKKLGNKIVVELVLKLLTRAGLKPDANKTHTAELISSITRIPKSSIKTLLSLTSPIIPKKHYSRVSQLNKLLSELGVNIKLTTKK